MTEPAPVHALAVLDHEVTHGPSLNRTNRRRSRSSALRAQHPGRLTCPPSVEEQPVDGGAGPGDVGAKRPELLDPGAVARTRRGRYAAVRRGPRAARCVRSRRAARSAVRRSRQTRLARRTPGTRTPWTPSRSCAVRAEARRSPEAARAARARCRRPTRAAGLARGRTGRRRRGRDQLVQPLGGERGGKRLVGEPQCGGRVGAAAAETCGDGYRAWSRAPATRARCPPRRRSTQGLPDERVLGETRPRGDGGLLELDPIGERDALVDGHELMLAIGPERPDDQRQIDLGR